MAPTNRERVGKAMDLLRDGLQPFVEREMKSCYGAQYKDQVRDALGSATRLGAGKNDPLQDVAVLLQVMNRRWAEVFGRTLGNAERSMVNELSEVRKAWAHQESFSSDDTDRALDSASRLLTAVSAPQSEDVNKMKMELRRLVFDEQVRGEKRKAGGSLIEGAASGALKPWREVVTPHADVASGRYQQAEFAADLWQVHLGEGTDEYRNPKEFFRRTFLTQSLKRLLIGGVKRLSGQGGDPVVQLQTNFGGGKTHSMLALYHMFSGTAPGELAGVEELLVEEGLKTCPKAQRVVLVGNKISPGNPVTKPDGTVVRTLWGELAWQLGGKKAYAQIKADDEKATSPGDALRKLFNEYGPCLILIDEWVAYARQLHDQGDLPAGTFETQFSFAQALTESAKAAKNCLLVISLPASDTQGSPHIQADDVEVGGIRGREALERLRNVVGRVESSWRPASAEEGFEIVRRRLFEPLGDKEHYKQRDVTAVAFSDFYRAQSAEFPPDCGSGEYVDRIKAAYPIHPEIFDRLYTDWSTLVKFQRTRGVLRLMAAVIHSLWEKGDHNPLIMPSTIPIDDARVQFELTRYLSDLWMPIIERDIDGPNSLPLRIDGEQPNLGKLSATRRAARTIFLGSAPTAEAAHRGIEDRWVKLGCVMPGEPPAIFGDALRRLSAAATYLYQDSSRFWYSTQPTVTKMAEDRAEQLKRDTDKVAQELEARVRENVRQMGNFTRVHALPRSSADVSDDLETRLVILPAEHPYSKEPRSPAEAAAQAILESRGNTPRIYRNTLVFLAVDKVRLQDLDEALRRFLAWRSILAEKEALNLDPFQAKQAETQLRSADGAITARLPEAYQWLLVPEQVTPQAPITWQSIRLSSSDPLAVRAYKKLTSDDSIVPALGSTILRKYLDEVPLWRGDDVSVKQLIEDFARFLYLPRLGGPDVLVQAVCDGVALLTMDTDAFAFAEGFDGQAGRYRGLRCNQNINHASATSGLVVKPPVARQQLESEKVEITAGPGIIDTGSGTQGGNGEKGHDQGNVDLPKPIVRRRFHATADLNPTRVGRDAGRIAEEVISHLSGQSGAKVRVTLEIEANFPTGASDHLVRIVTENSRALKFVSLEFEKE